MHLHLSSILLVDRSFLKTRVSAERPDEGHRSIQTLLITSIRLQHRFRMS
jgi:hypothetical protein